MLQVASRSRTQIRSVALLCVTALSFGAMACASDAPAAPAATEADTTQASEQGRLEPRYQPREPEPKPWYNSKLLFGMTRGVANSTIHPAAQVPLMVLTIPLDIVFLPFAAIGGFF